MSRKVIIFGIIILILIILVYGSFFKTKNENQIPIEQVDESSSLEREEGYDDYTGLYYIRDKETGEILFTSRNQEELDFYKEHPDYNPNPLGRKSSNLEDYVEGYPEELEK